MQEIAKLIDSMFSKIVDYGRTTIEIVKLKAVDKASDVVSTTIPRLVVIILIAFSLLFLNLGLAFWLSDLLDRVYLGFLIVGAFYLLVGIVLLLLHKPIKRGIRNFVVRELLK